MMKMLFTFLYLSSCVTITQLTCYAQQSAPKTSSLPSVTVRTIEQSIAKIGGKATLQKYFCGHDDNSTRDDYDQLDRVAMGSKEWVDLAVKMVKYADAGCSENICSYLGSAMQKQPRNVLPYVTTAPRLSPDLICLPFISNQIPEAEQLREVRRSKAALLLVKDKALQKQCQACMSRVTKLENKILADMARKKKVSNAFKE